MTLVDRRRTHPGAHSDTLGLTASRRRAVTWTGILAVVLVVTLVLSVGVGSVSVSPVDSAR
ncbi:MAG: iron ABC transporter permease, partial [Corynebacterium sp.]|nr:iron ABC transporter permease [Corynebacterium sp.]